MKIRYILIALLLLTQLGCSKWIELTPPSGLTRDEFWQTKEDVESVLMGAYGTFSNMDNLLFIHGEARADLLEYDVNLDANIQNIMKGNIYPDNWICGWENFYKVINFCNEIIENAPGVQEIDKTFTDYQLKGYMSEAYFIRSLAYFYLVRIYKDVPYYTIPNETDNADFYLAKTDSDEILTAITNDLLEARQYISDNYLLISEIKGRASKEACDALLAEIALWQYRYDDAIKHISDIENSEKQFELVKSERWFDLFYPGNSLQESIFEFQFDYRQNQNNQVYGLTAENSRNFRPSSTSIQMFALKYVSEQFRGEKVTLRKISDDNYTIWKYVGAAPDGATTRNSIEQQSANWIVYRYADIMLMKAEALSQVGRYQEALNLINEIRVRAGVSLLNLSDSPIAYEDAILEERALELAYEGKRWFDLLRMGRRNNYARKDKLVELIIKNVPSTQKRILGSKLTDPNGWYMPIHKDEIERNLNLKQNPYYIK